MAGTRAAALTAGLAGLVLAASTGSAAAAPPIRQDLSGPFQIVVPDFCGSGLQVLFQETVVGRNQFTVRGSGQQYYLDHVRADRTFTVVDDSGNQVAGTNVITERLVTSTKDLTVTPLEGTRVLIEDRAVGTATQYGPDGKAIGRDPGQFRYQFVLDTRGTVDPDDDVFIEDRGVTKPSTGRSDDFCTTVVTGLLG